MIELTKTYRITIGVVVLLAIIILGFIFLSPPKYTFSEPLADVLTSIEQSEGKISPDVLAKAIVSKDPNIVLVDVRSAYEYAKGHFPEAKNITNVNIFPDDQVHFFQDIDMGAKKAILYGSTPVEASTPFMVLKQMGFKNIGYLEVGYDFFSGKDLAEVAQQTFDASEEKPIADFEQFIIDAQKNASENSQSPVVIVKKPTQKIQVKAKAKVAEDEGC